MKIYLDTVRAETAKVLSIEEGAILDDSSLVNDLGADSLDIMDLTYSLAQKFKIIMPTTSLYQHAVDNLTEQELAELFDDSTLTEKGKLLFSKSCYKYTKEQLDNIQTLGDIYSETNISNWAALCKAVTESEAKNADQLLIDGIKIFFQK
ncbi:TPA: acyl carrier protein [Klebsiella oxytoca]|uniref:acyl carrier protein n=1 Tax=Klebsiella oxytoca TaxID=571 RepID=UPI001A2F458F|nr:acyl carrier protein [Klebsiella oxytoca]MCW9547276.1 acyl carrier protein [Klebsiella oxytoca]HAT2828650.1 acyl carrier protein [Klebsiella oxytoca]